MFCKMFEFKWHHESWVKGHSGGSSSDVLRHDVLSEEASNRGLVVQRDVQQLWCVLQLLSVPPLAPRTLLAVETGLAGRHLSHVTAPGVDVMSSDWRGKTFVSSLIWEFLCLRWIHTNSDNQTERRMKTPYLLFLFCEALLHKYSLLSFCHCYCEQKFAHHSSNYGMVHFGVSASL